MIIIATDSYVPFLDRIYASNTGKTSLLVTRKREFLNLYVKGPEGPCDYLIAKPDVRLDKQVIYASYSDARYGFLMTGFNIDLDAVLKHAVIDGKLPYTPSSIVLSDEVVGFYGRWTTPVSKLSLDETVLITIDLKTKKVLEFPVSRLFNEPDRLRLRTNKSSGTECAWAFGRAIYVIVAELQESKLLNKVIAIDPLTGKNEQKYVPNPLFFLFLGW